MVDKWYDLRYGPIDKEDEARRMARLVIWAMKHREVYSCHFIGPVRVHKYIEEELERMKNDM